MVSQLMTKDIVIRNAHGNVRVQSVMRSVSQSARLHSVRPVVKSLTHPVVVWSATSLNVQWSATVEPRTLAHRPHHRLDSHISMCIADDNVLGHQLRHHRKNHNKVHN